MNKKEFYEDMIKKIEAHEDFGKRNSTDIGIECGYSEEDIKELIKWLETSESESNIMDAVMNNETINNPIQQVLEKDEKTKIEMEKRDKERQAVFQACDFTGFFGTKIQKRVNQQISSNQLDTFDKLMKFKKEARKAAKTDEFIDAMVRISKFADSPQTHAQKKFVEKYNEVLPYAIVAAKDLFKEENIEFKEGINFIKLFVDRYWEERKNLQ